MKNKSVYFVMGITFLFLLMVLYSTLYIKSFSHVHITVIHKERVSYGSDNIVHKYLIFTEKETFEISDTILFLRFDSSDVYGKIAVGDNYHADVVGWRVPFFNSYRNIVEIYK